MVIFTQKCQHVDDLKADVEAAKFHVQHSHKVWWTPTLCSPCSFTIQTVQINKWCETAMLHFLKYLNSETHLSLVTPIRLMLLTSKIRSPDLSRPGTESDRQTDGEKAKWGTITVSVNSNRSTKNTRRIATIQSGKPTSDHSLYVDTKLLSCQLSVAPNYFNTCEHTQMSSS